MIFSEIDEVIFGPHSRNISLGHDLHIFDYRPLIVKKYEHSPQSIF